jgi:hypothetical protein
MGTVETQDSYLEKFYGKTFTIREAAKFDKDLQDRFGTTVDRHTWVDAKTKNPVNFYVSDNNK